MKLSTAKTALMFIVLMCAPFTRACAEFTPARILLGSREASLAPSPVHDGRRVLAPIPILAALGASHIAPTDMKHVTVIARDGASSEVATVDVAGTPMLPMDRVLAVVGGSSSWDADKRTLTLLAKLQSVEFADGALRINYSFPVTCKTGDLTGKVWVDVDGAVLATDAKEVYVGGPVVDRARLGQYTDTTARVTLDLLKPASCRIEGPMPSSQLVLRIGERGPNAGDQSASKSQSFAITDVRVQTVNESQFDLIVSTANKGRATVDYGVLPPQVVLRLPGGVLPESLPPVAGSHALLKGVTCRSSSTGVGTLITLDLARISAYDLTVNDNNVTLSVRIPDKAGGKLSEKLIAIDPGHLGGKKGASCGGVREEDLNLKIAQELTAALQLEGARTIYTWTGANLSLADRSRVAVDNRADLFISIHCNSCLTQNTASGIETYYHRAEPGGRQSLAYAIHAGVCARTGMCDRGARGAGFMVLRELADTGVPGILLECGYLNHSGDRAKLLSAEYRQKLISGIIAGLKAYVEGTGVN